MTDLEPINIAYNVMSKVQSGFDKDSRDLIGLTVLKTIADTLGIDFIAECMSPYPNGGYMVRYTDDVSAKWIAEQHRETIEENKERIKKILDEAN